MRVRLVKKLAEMIDGIDLKYRQVGDLLDVSPHEARLLFAEQWAVPAQQRRRQYGSGTLHTRAVAAERPRPSKPKRILVVEDHDDLRTLFRAALSGAGFDVTEARDGVQALRHLQGDLPDLVVLDLRLPRLNGVDRLDTDPHARAWRGSKKIAG